MMNQTPDTSNHIDDDNPGPAIVAALRSNMSLLRELAMRYQVATHPERPETMPQISCPQDIHNIVGLEMENLAQEQLRVLLLNNKNQVVSQNTIYQGTVNASSVRTAEVLRPAIIEAAPYMIVVHNHPSGDPKPSPQDVAVTRQLMQAAQTMDIEILDHIIIGYKKYISLSEQGLMKSKTSQQDQSNTL